MEGEREAEVEQEEEDEEDKVDKVEEAVHGPLFLMI